MGTMLIVSRFPGRCSACGGPIEVGAKISWTKGVREVQHAACSEEGRAQAAAVAVNVAASRATDAAIDVPVPAGLSYLPFQRAGIAYASSRKGVLIADEMGLGKTIQALGVINADETLRDVIVIAPKSLTINWVRESKKWLVRETSVTRGIEGYAGGVLVVSYEEARKNSQALAARAWDLVVVDEAHYIKNSRAQRSQAVQAIACSARRRVVLTGTPIANRPIELFSLLQVACPEEWDRDHKGFFAFARRYCGASKSRYGWDFSGATNLPELQEKLRTTCMVRRLKKDVLTELPAKVRQVVEIPTNGATRVVEAESRAWAKVEDGLDAARVEVELAQAEDDGTYESAVSRLRELQATAFAEISRLRHATAVAKVPYVAEHVRDACEDDVSHKVVVMAHHHDVIDSLVEELAPFGVVCLTGDTSLEDRQSAVDRFQTDPSCRVFVGSIMAAGVGITLTAASHVVFAELDWTPGNISQAEDRCHRIGQTQSVLVQHLVFDASLDARMAHVLVEKQRVADAGLDLLPKVVTPSREVPATSGKRAELAEVASKLTAEQIERVHLGLRLLAGMCDGARGLDGMGFARIDVAIGHSLAAAASLSPKQAALGLRLCRKYKRQLGAGFVEVAA
jgi:SWI/SNF-related matrix-associated actin-dependent regulator 1 of chromatin subfamily A